MNRSKEEWPATHNLPVVFDSNIYISAAAKPQGLEARMLRLAVTGAFILLTSKRILSEVGNTLKNKFNFRAGEIKIFIDTVLTVAQLIQEYKGKLSVTLRDPNEEKIIRCAKGGKAAVIVSKDKDLLVLKNYEGISIQHVYDFKNLFRE